MYESQAWQTGHADGVAGFQRHPISYGYSTDREQNEYCKGYAQGSAIHWGDVVLVQGWLFDA